MSKGTEQIICKSQTRRNTFLHVAVGVILAVFATQQSVAKLSGAAQERITLGDILSGDPVPANDRIAYGDHPLQFGDLRFPDSPGPWPVAVLIHGGCWLDIATLQYFDRVAVAITNLGIAT